MVSRIGRVFKAFSNCVKLPLEEAGLPTIGVHRREFIITTVWGFWRPIGVYHDHNGVYHDQLCGVYIYMYIHMVVSFLSLFRLS